MIRSGKLRHRVTIETFTESQDSFGEPDKSWSTYDTLWAEVRALRGDERFDSDQEVAISDTLVRIRYRSGITPEMRVVWGSHTYDIDAILDQTGYKRELHLMCHEVNPAAT